MLSALALFTCLPNCASTFAAAPVPVLGEIEVAGPTSGHPFTFDGLAYRPDGEFIVVWYDGDYTSGEYDVFGRVFDQGGDGGAPFQLNTYFPGRQWEPSIATDADGGFVVVWGAYTDGDPDQGVVARRYDAATNPIGGEFQVNVATEGAQFVPHVATTPSGGFVVVWDSGGYFAQVERIHGRRFDAAGQAQGSEFAIADSDVGDPKGVRVSINDDGRALASWWQTESAQSGYDVFARSYDAEGNAGAQFQVNTHTTDTQWAPSSAALADGTFLVAWTGWGDQDGSATGIFARIVGSNGALVGEEFQVNSYSTGYQYNSAVAAVDGDKFIVAWTGNTLGGDGTDVVARVFDATGAPLTGDFLVNTPASSINTPAGPLAAMSSTTTTLCAPVESARYLGSRVRRPPFRLKDWDPCVPRNPGELLASVAGHESGRFVVTWIDDYRTPGVLAKRFTLNPHCGDADDDGVLDATDALQVLRCAVALIPCSACTSDVRTPGGISASDGLMVLQKVTGSPVDLQCMTCGL